MGFFGGLLGGIGGFWMGGPIGAVAGAVGGGGVEEALGNDEGEATVSYPKPVDYSTAMEISSENNKTTSLAQIMTQRFALQQASLDHDLQLAASLELSLEKYDTRLQTTKLDYFAGMHAEENRHLEKMAASRAASPEADFPEPSVG